MKFAGSSRRLTFAATMLFAAAAAAGGIGVPRASASTLCQSHYGKLCGMTEKCRGLVISQCVTEYYYFGALEEDHDVV